MKLQYEDDKAVTLCFGRFALNGQPYSLFPTNCIMIDRYETYDKTTTDYQGHLSRGLAPEIVKPKLSPPVSHSCPTAVLLHYREYTQ
jgi:hypothetical protein